MAKKKPVSIIERLEETASDVANAISVAATGSEIGILELATEDEFRRRPAKKRKVKATKKKTQEENKEEKESRGHKESCSAAQADQTKASSKAPGALTTIGCRLTAAGLNAGGFFALPDGLT